jgi:hypothetical protein
MARSGFGETGRAAVCNFRGEIMWPEGKMCAVRKLAGLAVGFHSLPHSTHFAPLYKVGRI